MPLSTGQLILARFVWKVGDHHFYVCRHYRATTVIGVVTHNTVALWLANLHASRIAACMAGPYVQVGTYTHTIKPLSTLEVGFGTYSPSPTPYSNNPLPPQVACLVRLHVLVPSPRNHGRLYIPMQPVEAMDTDGTMLSTYQTYVATTLSPLKDQVNAGIPPNTAVLIPSVWKRPGNTSVRVTSLAVVRKWATQRRRGGFETPTPSPYRSLD